MLKSLSGLSATVEGEQHHYSCPSNATLEQCEKGVFHILCHIRQLIESIKEQQAKEKEAEKENPVKEEIKE